MRPWPGRQLAAAANSMSRSWNLSRSRPLSLSRQTSRHQTTCHSSSGGAWYSPHLSHHSCSSHRLSSKSPPPPFSKRHQLASIRRPSSPTSSPHRRQHCHPSPTNWRHCLLQRHQPALQQRVPPGRQQRQTQPRTRPPSPSPPAPPASQGEAQRPQEHPHAERTAWPSQQRRGACRRLWGPSRSHPTQRGRTETLRQPCCSQPSARSEWPRVTTGHVSPEAPPAEQKTRPGRCRCGRGAPQRACSQEAASPASPRPP
mmetsp:Transcript_88205/g.224561  ORF Transcript_88205/g.224561 Transcript_88205/m.224561 type:complete len:257 (+) Transcript_88205:372-1142(+)